ncbi:MAG: SAM-dependent methyltransferase [Betaproteobacteria bacterium]|nr:SAM-dependent methyltransferase [Betaproteobacteria bacterium]MSQ88075.1 SAM-dependent methyltransferase [Betaproteobacteria bacterium]
MKFPLLIKAVALALVFLAGIAAALAQTPPGAAPQAGQRGKDVMWMATADALAERMLDLAGVTDKDYVIDLGSGDGVLVIAAAKRGARALGIEYDQGLYELSKRRATEVGVAARTSFIKGDIFESDLSAASVITLYLTESVNLRLRPRLFALKPGTRIVSNSFQLGAWRADDSATAISFKALLAPFLESTKDHCFFFCTAYLWIVPANVEGRWRIVGGELVLRQSFQIVSGVVVMGGKSVPLHGRLRGQVISFTAGNTDYVGQVGDGRIDGTTVRNGVATPWNATLSAAAPNAS